jgi:peptide/nickel transport system ATP-binding protein
MPTAASAAAAPAKSGWPVCTKCSARSGCATRNAWPRSYPIMLSGGMRQRVLIAMALLSEPKLLIADEPGTALDVTTQAQILKLLKDLVEERGLALLMITHNLGVVRETSNYVYVMNKGVVVEHRPTAELFEAPRDDYTKALIAAVPRLTGGTRFGKAGATA